MEGMVQLDDGLPTEGPRGEGRTDCPFCPPLSFDQVGDCPAHAHARARRRWPPILPLPDDVFQQVNARARPRRRSGGTIKAALGGQVRWLPACLPAWSVDLGRTTTMDGASDLLVGRSVGPTAGRRVRVTVELWQQNSERESRSQLPIKSDTAEKEL